MFSGIGGFREGLTRAGDFLCAGHCEIDAAADRSYANHYATIRKWLDEDSKSKPGKNFDYTETYEEGECL